MACGWAWLWRSSPVATSEGRVGVFKPLQNTFTSCTSWGKLAGTPSILMNDPTRLTWPPEHCGRRRLSAVKEQTEIELGLQATVMSATKRSKPRTWSARIGFEMRTHSFWTKLPVPHWTHK